MAVKFNPEISFGHLIQAGVLIIGGLSLWFTTVNRIDSLEKEQARAKVEFEKSQAETKEQFKLMLTEMQKQTALNQKNSVELEKLNLTQGWMKETLEERWKSRERLEGNGR